MMDVLQADWSHFNSSINQERTACLLKHLNLMLHCDLIKYVGMYIYYVGEPEGLMILLHWEYMQTKWAESFTVTFFWGGG